MALPNLGRLPLAAPTGMMQAPASNGPPDPFNTNPMQSAAADEIARRVAARAAAGQQNVVEIWQSLAPQQQQAVVELLKLEKQRTTNDLFANTTAQKTEVTKAMNYYERMLPANLHNRKWKGKPWQVVLTGPEYADLFTSPEGPGFYGYQIGEDEPNQPKDYGRQLVYNPYGGWDNPYSSMNRPTGATPEEKQAAADEAWAAAYYAGATPAEQDQAARRAREALERMENLMPPDDADVPPAPPPPDQQPELNAWNALNANYQDIVLQILAQKKKLREYRYGYRGHEPGIQNSVPNAVEHLTAQLPPALNTPQKFNSIDWELALQGQPAYDYVFGIGGYRSD